MKIITHAVLEWDEELGRYVTVEEEWFEYDGPMAECKKPKAPAPPDPNQVARAQSQQNQQAAEFNAAMNRVNTYSPLGSQEFSITGTDPRTGAPIYRQDINLDPQVEGLFRQQMGQDQQLGDVASRLMGQLPTSPFSLSGLPGRSNLDDIRQTTQDALYDRHASYMEPQLARDEDALRTRMANQGVAMGSEAFDNAMTDFDRSRETARRQARNEAIIGGGAEADRAFSMDEQLRNNALSEMLLGRSVPYQELAQIRGMTGQAELPQFQGMSQASMAPADIQGAIQNQYQGQMDAYNAKVQQRNALLQAGAGIGSAFLLSDERTKEDIHEVGELPRDRKSVV